MRKGQVWGLKGEMVPDSLAATPKSSPFLSVQSALEGDGFRIASVPSPLPWESFARCPLLLVEPSSLGPCPPQGSAGSVPTGEPPQVCTGASVCPLRRLPVLLSLPALPSAPTSLATLLLSWLVPVLQELTTEPCVSPLHPGVPSGQAVSALCSSKCPCLFLGSGFHFLFHSLSVYWRPGCPGLIQLGIGSV